MISFVDNTIAGWSESSGLDEASLKLAICLLASFPLNVVLKRLPDDNITLKNVYIIAVSSVYLFVICDLFSGFRTLFISTMFTYLITTYLKSDFMPYINFVFVMGHLAMNHLNAQFFTEADFSKIDITGAQMVLCMKLTGYAWNVYDGRRPAEELSQFQRDKAIYKTPSFLSFISYAFFYPSLLTGPSFDFRDYESWLNSEMFSDLPVSKKPGKRRKRNIPRSGRVTFYRVIQGIAWLVVWQKSGDYVQLSHIFTKEFAAKNFLFKLAYFYFLCFSHKLKYYAAWTISEASCILCGLGYNGYDPETKTIRWDRVQNIDIYGVESAQNIHVVLSSWNQNTNKWLKNYVYLRTVKKGKKPGFRSTMATFLTSAFWHGTRPGYYLSFATGAFAQTCNRFYRRNFRPIFMQADGITPLPSKIVYDVICFIVTQCTLAYLVQPFVILDFKQSLRAWGVMNYYVHIGMAITLFAFQGPFSKQLVGFIKQFHPVKPAQKESIVDIIKEKNDYEESEDVHLGIPEPTFDHIQVEQFTQELNDITAEFKKWQDQKGPEIEGQKLREAYERLSKDLEDVKKKSQPRRMSTTKKEQ
ncbi:CYFA0S06e04170g1_1 [Cyberlindnera fabianii]|uniref:CYFA0S06e04170g1_1 n=1 Tax=Cyberlindnera fabianii TaxID=36022 RepID=A0A061AUG0_CYBFA|nr:Lysophospholipid acyltransferase [Cyberlindnera fabianii]CDR41219.1 CYFA0S06e04170g1_1 [Cyberlindnera fabianii]